MATSSSHMGQQQIPPASLKGVGTGYQSSVEYNESRMKGVYMPNSSPYDISTSARSQTSPMMGDGGEQTESHPLIGDSINAIDDKQVVQLICLKVISNLNQSLLAYCWLISFILT